jgi:hypothetical protein
MCTALCFLVNCGDRQETLAFLDRTAICNSIKEEYIHLFSRRGPVPSDGQDQEGRKWVAR